MRLLALLALAAIAPPAAVADLPPDGWPQQRRDAHLTGRSLDPLIADPVVLWRSPAGPTPDGEILAHGCSIVVPWGADNVVRLNARSGAQIWGVAQSSTCPGHARSTPALAIQADDDVAHASGADEAPVELQRALDVLNTGCNSYRIDNNVFPPGSSLPGELAPTYIPWPDNPCTGAPMAVTDTPSVGDARYERMADGNGFWLGGWWTDGGLIPASSASCCGSNRGLAPTWPRSQIGLGCRGVLDGADGSVAWREADPTIAGRSYLSLGAGTLVFARDGHPDVLDLTSRGVIVVGADGSPRWSVRRVGGAAAQAAITSDGRILTSFRTGIGSRLFDRNAETLAIAINSYVNDASALPPDGELAPALVPLYLRAMPPNPFTGAPMAWSSTPSPGDYDYSTRNGATEYSLDLWNQEGVRVARWDTFSFVGPSDVDRGAVECFDSAGARLWRTELPPLVSAGPLAVTADERAVVFADDAGALHELSVVDGSETWSADLGVSITSPPAILGDGGVALLAGRDARLLVVDLGAGVRWDIPLPATSSSTVSVTSDDWLIVGDDDGTLHALRGDAPPAWSLALDAGNPVISAAMSEHVVHVLLADGSIVTLAPRLDAPPPDPGPVLRIRRGAGGSEVVASWAGATLPAILGAHYHLELATSARGVFGNVLGHDEVGTSATTDTPGEPLVFFRLRVADCGDVASLP